MTVARELVDEIVAGVMQRLRQRSAAAGANGSATGSGDAAQTGFSASRLAGARDAATSEKPTEPEPVSRGCEVVRVEAPVVTADVLLAALEGRQQPARLVRLPRSAILTPAARDVLTARGLKCVREHQPEGRADRDTSAGGVSAATDGRKRFALVIVQSTPAVLAAWETLARSGQWCREMCDDVQAAGRFCIREMARGALVRAVVLTGEPDHAACLANRHRCVRAGVVDSAVDVRSAMRRWRANVFCVRPDDRLVFAWTRLFQSVAQQEV